MKKVYIVTSGDYSDYYIVGGFSTLNKAKTYIGEVYKEKYMIEPLPIDILPPLVWKTKYTVYIDTDGDETKCHLYDEEVSCCTQEMLRGRSIVTWDKSGYIGISFVSKGHALKLAAECRQAHLREQGITPTVENSGQNSL